MPRTYWSFSTPLTCLLWYWSCPNEPGQKKNQASIFICFLSLDLQRFVHLNWKQQALVFITLYFKRHTKQSLFFPRERNKVSRTKLYPKKNQHFLCFSWSKPLSTFYTAAIVTSGTVWWQLLQPAQSAACRLLCICENETFCGISGGKVTWDE